MSSSRRENNEVPNEQDERRYGPAGSSPNSVRGIRGRLAGLVPSLQPASRRTAEYILDHVDQVIHMSVTDLAAEIGVSDATIVRLCQQVGAKGFQDLKLALTMDTVEPVKLIHEDVSDGDGPQEVVDKVFDSAIKTLSDTRKILDVDAIRQAAEIILAADKVEFYSIGGTAPVALDAYFRMLWIGINAYYVTDDSAMAIRAAMAGPKTAVVTISHSGSNRDTVEATRLAKESGAMTIAIVNFGKSPLHNYADIIIHTASEETFLRPQSMASRIAQITALDALYTYVALLIKEQAIAGIERAASSTTRMHY
jgi:DNA-binding MurR/RpiR family transcriptional regulator